MPSLKVTAETWPIRGSFTISRDSQTTVELVVVELSEDGVTGRGECRPYARYEETVAEVVAAIESLRGRLQSGLDRIGLQSALPSGAARNALDCAFWDLEAKRAGHRVWALLGQDPPVPLETAYTLSLEAPDAMGRAAAAQAGRPLLKLKLGGAGDFERVAAVRENAPEARLIIDANEGWSVADYAELAPRFAALGVEMVEQPFPAAEDAVLNSLARPIKVCADESCHDSASLERLAGRYDMINIKLDKTGGLTEALALKAAARHEASAS